MNKTQRAVKKSLRKLENGRQSFKKIYLNGSEVFASTADGKRIKALQKELKDVRRKTRNTKLDFIDSDRTFSEKEDIEV